MRASTTGREQTVAHAWEADITSFVCGVFSIIKLGRSGLSLTAGIRHTVGKSVSRYFYESSNHIDHNTSWVGTSADYIETYFFYPVGGG